MTCHNSRILPVLFYIVLLLQEMRDLIADSGNMDPAELARRKEQLKQRQQVLDYFFTDNFIPDIEIDNKCVYFSTNNSFWSTARTWRV